MAKHHQWSAYYWAFIKQCGHECWKTWRGEVLVSAITSGFIYLITPEGIDVRTVILATAYTLCIFVLWHTVRIPWILYEKLDEADHLKKIWGISGIVFMGGTLVLFIYAAAWFFTMQPPVKLALAATGKDAR